MSSTRLLFSFTYHYQTTKRTVHETVDVSFGNMPNLGSMCKKFVSTLNCVGARIRILIISRLRDSRTTTRKKKVDDHSFTK